MWGTSSPHVTTVANITSLTTFTKLIRDSTVSLLQIVRFPGYLESLVNWA